MCFLFFVADKTPNFNKIFKSFDLWPFHKLSLSQTLQQRKKINTLKRMSERKIPKCLHSSRENKADHNQVNKKKEIIIVPMVMMITPLQNESG